MSDESATTTRPSSPAAVSAPNVIPRVQPMTHELLQVIARLMVENDGYRETLGLLPIGPNRRWSQEELAQGKELGPYTFLDDGGLVVRLEK